MAGHGALLGGFSYLAVGEENFFKTYNTCTAILPFLSASIQTTQEDKILEEVSGQRTYRSRMSLTRKTEGEVEFYFYPAATASAYILKNAFGGVITSATATGELTGGAAFDHVLDVGAYNQSISSLCLNHRKGDSVNGKVFAYRGARVNELMFTAEVDEALKANMSIMAIDVALGGDVEGALGAGVFNPLSFVGGRISVADSIGGIVTNSAWCVQSAEFGISNSIKNDAASGCIGHRTLDVLPPGMASLTFNVGMRFDTTTAFDAMLNETRLAAELEFLGATIPGSALRERLLIQMPRVYVGSAPEPEVGGPDETLLTEVGFSVIRDTETTTGYAFRATLRNGIAAY